MWPRRRRPASRAISVALIGGDGAGKSTIARRLVDDPDLDFAYMYMGPSLESASHLLPWSKFALRKKLARLQREAIAAGTGVNGGVVVVNTHSLEQRQTPSSLPRFVARSANQYIELLYRLAAAANFRRQGHSVVFDRHILYEISAPATVDDLAARLRSIYVRLLHRTCPQPDLTLLLLASPEVMLARKGETDLAYLQQRNDGWLEATAGNPSVVRISADGEPDEVYGEVVDALRRELHNTGSLNRPG